MSRMARDPLGQGPMFTISGTWTSALPAIMTRVAFVLGSSQLPWILWRRSGSVPYGSLEPKSQSMAHHTGTLRPGHRICIGIRICIVI